MGTADRTLKFKFNPQQTGLTMVLGPLESEIMQIVWRLNRATVSDVHHEIQAGASSRREIAYTTVMTTMSRLAEKNVLRREKPAGQVSFVYSPALEQEEFVNMVVKNVMDSLVTQFREPVMRYFTSYMAATEVEQRDATARAVAAETPEAG
jgi:predicted transcriptional regulator